MRSVAVVPLFCMLVGGTAFAGGGTSVWELPASPEFQTTLTKLDPMKVRGWFWPTYRSPHGFAEARLDIREIVRGGDGTWIQLEPLGIVGITSNSDNQLQSASGVLLGGELTFQSWKADNSSPSIWKCYQDFIIGYGYSSYRETGYWKSFSVGFGIGFSHVSVENAGHYADDASPETYGFLFGGQIRYFNRFADSFGLSFYLNAEAGSMGEGYFESETAFYLCWFPGGISWLYFEFGVDHSMVYLEKSLEYGYQDELYEWVYDAEPPGILGLRAGLVVELTSL